MTETSGALLFLAHACPYVGVEDVGTGRRLARVAHQAGAAPRETDAAALLEDGRVGVVPWRGAHDQVEIGQAGGRDPGIEDVVSVAYIGHGQPLDASLVFADGLDVGQDLAGVVTIGEAVDDGQRPMGAPGLQLALAECADDQTIGVAGQDPGGILDRLAPVDLALLGA
jgi:hypothetical protein